ncbi:hypothetical protein GJR96_17065 [Haloferax sp. MBLA0076]|uniref:DUF2238 domain-containing protein n=1 Tax=Haloferax litoreum TaxID=2666140 RepID=A0A6A8GK43_9EURY|nr:MULTISPECIES: hypothetical protein [Haloferax]KAB1189893.1 hypothetical protein Hfx1148_17010 [Haloferax sp. CBA1148]MRX23658.1 hypothetical protein [Haloferax litoreum]
MTESNKSSEPVVVERGIRCAIVAVFVEGIRRRKPAAMVNAVISLVGTFIPWILERVFGTEFRPWQRIYVESAMLTHSVGMLGPYDDVWWWDHLTHTHSATVVGGVVHVVSQRRGKDPRPRVVAAILCLGIVWELTEYAIHFGAKRLGIEPILVSYGKVDTALDLVFNLFGAILVVLFGERMLQNLTSAD